MEENLIQIVDLCVYARFLHSTEKIVGKVSFSLCKGERLAIVGESGSGKSMIANALVSSLADNCSASGKVLFKGVDLLENPKLAREVLGKKIAFVPQGGAESLNPSLKIKTQIYEAFSRAGKKLNREEKRAYSIFNLARAGIKNGEELLEKYPFEISGGEAQRVVLAIALCCDPELIVADEATRGIDEQTSLAFWQCLDNDLSSASRIVVTHDMSVAKKCDFVLVLKDGQVQECGKSESVFSNPQNEYTKRLIAACEVQND